MKRPLTEELDGIVCIAVLDFDVFIVCSSLNNLNGSFSLQTRKLETVTLVEKTDHGKWLSRFKDRGKKAGWTRVS